MKTKTILLLALILLVGCKSQKKLTEDVNQNQAVNTEVSKTAETKTDLTNSVKSDKQTDISTGKIETETNDLETRTTIYDTDKPIVAGTNKPPVKEETIITNRKQIDNKTQSFDKSSDKTEIGMHYKASLISEIDSLKQIKASLTSKATIKETANSNWWKWFLAGIAVAIIAYLAWWVAYKKPWRIVSFLN